MVEAKADARVNNVSGNLVLDAITLERRAEYYPPEVREPFIWLGSYVREECARDLDLLLGRTEKLGIGFDKTTWSRILRGYLTRDSEGNNLPHPIVSVPKLLKAIDALRKDARIKELGGRIPFVITGTARKIFDYIDLKRSPDRVNKFGVVIGETGTQKTACFREYCRLNNHGACVWVDAPARGSMYQFKTDLAARYGCHANTNSAGKEQRIAEAVNERKTVIVENVQRLYDRSAGSRQPIFEYVQSLQEKTGCTIILSFTPSFDLTFQSGAAQGFFEQFIGRSGGQKAFLRLDPFPPEDDCVAIAQAFGLRDAERHADYLVKMAREPGRVRVLFEALQQAKIRAEAQGEKLTLSQVKYARGEE